jgi:hypothetical protein
VGKDTGKKDLELNEKDAADVKGGQSRPGSTRPSSKRPGMKKPGVKRV